MTARQELDSFIAKYSPEMANIAHARPSHGCAGLPDPHKLLKGSGNADAKHPADNAELLDRPEMLALIDAEAARSGLGPGASSGKIVIESIWAKQRLRRPT